MYCEFILENVVIEESIEYFPQYNFDFSHTTIGMKHKDLVYLYLHLMYIHLL